MKISINWIKEFVNLDGIEPEEIVKRFNLATAEIEGVEYKGKDTYNVVFGKIIEVQNHPESNKLHILKVDVKSEVLQIVCGAPNVRANMVTCVAKVGGAVCGHKIGAAKLAGIDSFGMCCSAKELDIGEDDEGIMDITENVPLGEDIKNVFNIDDVVFEIDNKTLTNRPDLWGHYGMAREIAVIFGRKLKDIKKVSLTDFDLLPKLDVKVESKNCYRYSAIAIDNVTVKKSPMNMAIRLYYAGMRDINLLADVTNYIMLELGQPMHAFDHEIVKGIKVVDAKKGDKLLTLEGEEHELSENTLVIADNKGVPVAIGGIKGGMKASISEQTTNVLVESATFDSVSVRKASRTIGLSTDASARYEKSLDPELVPVATARFIEILKSIDKGIKVSSKFTDVYTKKYALPKIKITADFISSRIGENISESEIIKVLAGLGFDVTKNGKNIEVVVPSFRATKDVSMEEDLVEEIARIYGYDNITPKPLAFEPKPTFLNTAIGEEYEVKKYLAEKYNGVEIHSYIWNYQDFNASHFIDSKSYIKLMDSSNAGQSGIRSELAPTLLKVISENRNTLSEMRVFEIGRVATGIDENNLAIEKKKLAVVFASQTKDTYTLFDTLKEFIVSYAKTNLALDIVLKEGDKPSYMHPYNTFRVTSREGDYGYIGILNPKVSKSIDKRLNIVVLEIDFGLMSSKHGYFKKVKVPYKYQSTNLDVSVLVPENMNYGALEQILNKYRSKIMVGYVLKDIYQSEALQGKKSITVSYELSGKDHTLEGSEIDEFLSGLISHIEKNKLEIRKN